MAAVRWAGREQGSGRAGERMGGNRGVVSPRAAAQLAQRGGGGESWAVALGIKVWWGRSSIAQSGQAGWAGAGAGVDRSRACCAECGPS